MSGSSKGVLMAIMGHQSPRIERVPSAPSSAGAEAVELAAAAGLALDPWQRLVLERSLRERDNGQWASFEVGLCVARQSGKGAVLEARELAGLFLFGEKMIIHSAHEFRTASEAFRRLEFLIAETPDLSRRVKRVSRSHGEEGIELVDGSRIMFRTRTKSGGRGLSGDLVILDEAMILSYESVGALLPTLATRPNPQVWYTGSAVDHEVHDKGFVFSAVRQRALAGDDPRLCYLEWSCEEGADASSPESWAQANPGMGIRISEEFIAAEHRALSKSPKTFAVERLSIGDWPADKADVAQVIDPEEWGKRRDDTPEPVGSAVIGLVLAPDRSHWAIVAGQHTAADRIHVEVGSFRPMSHDDVVRYVSAVVTDWDPAAVVLDARGLAKVIVPKLQAVGIEPELLNTPQVAGACGGFIDDVEAGVISHSGQPVLDSAARGLTLRDLPQGDFVFEATNEAAPIVGAMLAREGVLRFASKPTAAPASPAFRTEATPVGETSGVDLLTVAF